LPTGNYAVVRNKLTAFSLAVTALKALVGYHQAWHAITPTKETFNMTYNKNSFASTLKLSLTCPFHTVTAMFTEAIG